MGRSTIAALRVLLVVIMLGGLAGQLWFFPTLAGELARTDPELEWLGGPLLAVVVLVILGAQVALVALWRLLSMVERDSVFSPDAFKWVDVIIIAAIIDTVLVLGIWALLTFGANANPPALMLTELALVVCGAALALLMAVMKGLLRKASLLRVELSGVV
ncbi:MAG: DUF2975 domain-containing protein [Propionibacteriaceae bacterium]|nr:DUF2975 domain-containing protein [Propionibacteriaceae bacterium]